MKPGRPYLNNDGTPYVMAPCARPHGHPGRCRNTAGTTWEGACNAPEPDAAERAAQQGGTQ